MFFTRQIDSTKEIGGGEFLCPNCERRVAFAHLRDTVDRITVLLFFPIRSQDEIVREYVVCKCCNTDFPPSILLDTSSTHFSPESSLKNVVALSEAAADEIQSRFLAGGFPPESYVRIIPECQGTTCRVEIDMPYADEREWLGRSSGFSVVVDRDVAESIMGMEVHFDGQAFTIRPPQ